MLPLQHPTPPYPAPTPTTATTHMHTNADLVNLLTQIMKNKCCPTRLVKWFTNPNNYKLWREIVENQ